MKSRGYESEREVRYFVQSPDNPHSIHQKEPGFVGETSASYINITGNRDARWAVAGHDPDYYQSAVASLPLVAIRLGPHHGPGERSTLRRVLDDAGYSDVSIKRSRSTQRRKAPSPAAQEA